MRVWTGSVLVGDPTQDYTPVMTVARNVLRIDGPDLKKNDGGAWRPSLSFDDLLDVMVVHDAEVPQLGSVLNELMDVRAKENRYVTYEQVSSLTIESARPMQLNLDGEPMRETTFEFRILPQVLPFVLGPNAPVQSGK